MRITMVCLFALSVLLATTLSAEPVLIFEDDFSALRQERWHAPVATGGWTVDNGVLQRSNGGDALYPASLDPQSNLSIETRVKVLPDSRQTFGLAVRVDGSRFLLVRYYDRRQALELLDFHGEGWTQVGTRSEELTIHPDTWYRLKVVVLDDRVVAKLWADGTEEPDWQLNAQASQHGSGTFALVSHDNTHLEFDWVRVHSHDNSMAELREEIDRQRQALLAGLKLAATVSAFDTPSAEKPMRHLILVPYVDNDRVPVEGDLTVSWDKGQITQSIALADYRQDEIRVELPSFNQPTVLQVRFEVDQIKTLTGEIEVQPAKLLPWRDYVQNSLDTLIEYGRDSYGEVHTPLFMAVLDADTRRSPSQPMQLGALVRLEERLHRRGERGTNPWYDQALNRSLRQMSDATGDEKYRQAADEAIAYFLENCRKEIDTNDVYLNGMPTWGTHIYWDCYHEQPAGDGDGNGPHEVLVYRANWADMYRQNPTAVRNIVDGMWQYHLVDKSTGLHNRHDDARPGCDFAFSGSSFAHAFASMYQATGNPRYLQQAKIVVDWHWLNRNTNTGLTADTPGLTNRYDGHHCFTTVVGPHALALLECYRLTGDEHFRDVAVTYIKAFDRYGWDAQEQTYWAMLRLDGTPIPEQAKGQGYDAYAPYGHVDVWRSTIYSYEFTLAAAQASVAAYETTLRDGQPDPQLLKIARRWGQVVEQSLPAKSSRRWKDELESALPEAKETGGAYAEDYGRAISLFVHLYRATAEQHYLDLAEQIATEAVMKLYRNGLLVGHPAKPYYECTDGVGLLLEALLELASPDTEIGTAW